MQGRPRTYKRGRNKHLCRWCKQRPAVFVRADGSMAADSEHDLCRQCWDRAKAIGEEQARAKGILTRRK